MTIRHVHPMTFAKVSGFLYALVGLVIGALLTLVSIVGVGKGTGGMFGAMFGVAAIIICPIIYGVIGFIGSLIGAALYNVAAGAVGGVTFDAE